MAGKWWVGVVQSSSTSPFWILQVERERRGCGEAIQSGGQDLPVGMEFLMQPIKRFMVPEEVNDCEIPMEPLHYPVAARSRINPHSMGRFVR